MKKIIKSFLVWCLIGLFAGSTAWAANTTIGTFNPATGYPGDGNFYGVLTGYYDDVGSAGDKAIGQVAPTGLDWTIAGIEIKGTP